INSHKVNAIESTRSLGPTRALMTAPRSSNGPRDDRFIHGNSLIRVNGTTTPSPVEIDEAGNHAA
ncbi:MAG TPA: hypothetical protein VGR76_09775, partial [Candidatus Angelobacter sp.]|nr:hypothetical protein [Candidatus Angelobacter sp.]